MPPVRCPLHRFACGRAANMGAQRAGAPVLTGSVPPLAPFYHARQETGFGLADALRPGETILLVPALLGTGGTGKTQLAVGFAHAMWSARAVDLLAWVPAGNRSAIIAGYARAAADLGLLADEEPAAGHGRRRRPAFPRLAAHDRAPLGGGTRRRGLPRRRRRAVAARPGGTGRRDQPAAGVRARLVRRQRDRPRRRRVQQAGGARLPQYPAHRLPRPADRGA